MTSTLSRDDLRTLTPSVFAATPWQGMSESYRFIPTADVLDLLEGQGFRVTSARQSRSRIEGKADFTRHMLRLRHDSFLDASDEVPEVVLVNSHDRSSAYRVFSGVFRLVCENGMIVQSSDFGSFSIRHSGSRDLFAQVREATARIMEGAPAILNRIEAWKQTILPRKDQLIMAAEAFALKPIDGIKPSFLLTARREADYTDSEGRRDLWRTTNCLQENLIRGGLTGRSERGRKVTTRSVKAVDADLRINRRLWELAETFSLN
ncbi:hypothetical protein OJF2_51560 [Aquisphaera giovannonii]|uniref:DUF945 domain-containing protein n=1 Tax=Aquisphaera giovannonii TaxID=406548 RepID=A0A5B9W7B5_9BACT|nr:DUF932 domain-containing protein [Aquisphaera giovannonii]QEH36572.1 hypothetical protein OJF2_51560 [Aquisphaera giovannonii]